MPKVRFDAGITLVVSGLVKVIEGLDGNTTVDMSGCRPIRVDPPNSYHKLPSLRVTLVERDPQQGLLSFRNPDMPIGVFDEVTKEIRIGKKGKVQVIMPVDPD